MSFSDLELRPVIAIAVAMLALWIFSLIKRDASIVDIFWGIGFIVVVVSTPGETAYAPRGLLVTFLVAIWGARLATHLYLRNRGHGEDPRYQAMRRRWGGRFPIASLFQVFVLQGVLMWIVSLPAQAAIASPTPPRITVLDILGAGVWVVGFYFEAVGDLQLTKFKSDPANAGKVMDLGLWRYTRHPNYFGDSVQWWGIGLIALATHSWWTIVGPVVMTVLLLRVSGVSLLERRMKRTRPEYAGYAARTSSFFPMKPRPKPPKKEFA